MMRGGFSVATIKSAVCGGFAVSLAALAGFSGFSAVAAPPAKAETCEATSTEQLVSCVAKVNASPGANKIVMAAGIYLPEATLRLKNTTGPTTLEGPAVGSRVAKLEGGSVVPFPSELMVISSGASVILKNLEEGTGGGGGLPAIDDFGSLEIANSTIGGNNGPAVHVESGATAAVTNSTLSDGLDFGLVNNGTASFLNATVAFNAAGGIENKGTLSLTNTIVAENKGSGD